MHDGVRDPDSTNISLEVYKNVFETWRFEVNSYWQRNTYFAAFETAAIGGSWYLVEHKTFWMGATFAVLGACLTGIWLWNNVAVHRYIEYWWACAKASERSLALQESELDFAVKHPGSDLTPSVGAKLVPVVFLAAWFAVLTYVFVHVCGCSS